MSTKLRAALAIAVAVSLACGDDDAPLPPDGNGGTVSKTVTIEPDADNTLYEQLPLSVSSDTLLSNGTGRFWFVGKTAGFASNNGIDRARIRRALVRFDVAGAVPAGATIDSVCVEAAMVKLPAPANPFTPKAADISLHRVSQDWGEGNGPRILGGEGKGREVVADEISWLHTFFDTGLWTTPGGDFEPMASANTVVDGIGTYKWGSTAEMVADVQAWLDNSANNFGWMFLGGEAAADSITAKQFGARENQTPEDRPKLIIHYTEP